MTIRHRYTIIPKPLAEKMTKRTAASHLRAAEIYARSKHPHPFLHVQRTSGEPKEDGEFQAYHKQEPIGHPYLVMAKAGKELTQ